MKLLSQLLFLTTALLASTIATASSDSYDGSNNVTSCKMIYINEENGEREQTVQISTGDGESASVLVPANTNSTSSRRRRRRQRQRHLQGRTRNEDVDDGSGPHPNDSDIKHLGNAIVFREDLSQFGGIDSVTGYCFWFQKGDNGTPFEVCEDDKIPYGEVTNDEDEVVELELTMMSLREDPNWHWWFAPYDRPEPDDKHTFSIYQPIVLNSAATALEEDVVEEAEWEIGGKIQAASGRLYFKTDDTDYACTGTAMKDRKSGRSLIITAAHCIWDDIIGEWATDVIFIPNRDAIQTNLTGKDIKRQCEEDICGCWTVSAGVVHDMWRDADWPHRLAYDYGLYVVDDEGMHEGADCGSDALDEAIADLEFEVGVDLDDMHTHSLGYSLEHNPDFRYCADTTGFREPVAGVDTYWLDGCGLTGGASGGPWIKGMDSHGKGTIVSVNSWSLSKISGMGGPIIDEAMARCLVNAARSVDFEAVHAKPAGEQGVFVNCYDRPCIPREEETEFRRLRGGSLDGRKLCEAEGEEKN